MALCSLYDAAKKKNTNKESNKCIYDNILWAKQGSLIDMFLDKFWIITSVSFNLL